MSIKIKVETKPVGLLFELVGELDISTSTELEQQIIKHKPEEPQHIIFDMTNLNYISSAGLRVLIIQRKRLSAVGKEILLVGVNGVIQEVLDISGFSQLFQSFPKLEDGIRYFENMR